MCKAESVTVRSVKCQLNFDGRLESVGGSLLVSAQDHRRHHHHHHHHHHRHHLMGGSLLVSAQDHRHHRQVDTEHISRVLSIPSDPFQELHMLGQNDTESGQKTFAFTKK